MVQMSAACGRHALYALYGRHRSKENEAPEGKMAALELWATMLCFFVEPIDPEGIFSQLAKVSEPTLGDCNHLDLSPSQLTYTAV
jgi:hypothetical protein